MKEAVPSAQRQTYQNILHSLNEASVTRFVKREKSGSGIHLFQKRLMVFFIKRQ